MYRALWGDMDLKKVIHVQGRTLSVSELSEIQQLIDQHPDWSRHAVGKELCERWDWRTALGELKTFAARSLLLTLEQRHELRLPTLRVAMQRCPWGLSSGPTMVVPPSAPLEDTLEGLSPLHWQLCPHRSPSRERALCYLCANIITWGAIVRSARICSIGCRIAKAAMWPFIWLGRRPGNALPAMNISAGVPGRAEPTWRRLAITAGS